MSLDKKSIFKKRQRKELKRNKKRKYIRASINGGRTQPLNETQRYLKSRFLKALKEGKIVKGPDGKYIAPSLATQGTPAELPDSVSSNHAEPSGSLPAKATSSQDDTIRT